MATFIYLNKMKQLNMVNDYSSFWILYDHLSFTIEIIDLALWGHTRDHNHIDDYIHGLCKHDKADIYTKLEGTTGLNCLYTLGLEISYYNI